MAKITPDDRVLKRGSLPFFWLGDTCWSAFTNMTDAEWQDYIIKRAAQGFNVVQVNALPQWDRCGSTLGLYPFATQDGLHFTYDGTLNEAYFARAGRMAALAAHYGITLAVAVQWCNYVPGTWAAAKHPENILPAAMVELVVKKICETFSAYDPVFLISEMQILKPSRRCSGICGLHGWCRNLHRMRRWLTTSKAGAMRCLRNWLKMQHSICTSPVTTRPTNTQRGLWRKVSAPGSRKNRY